MDNLLHILLAAALTNNMVTHHMCGVPLIHNIRHSPTLALLLGCATAALLIPATVLGHLLQLIPYSGEDGLVVPLLLPLLALLLAATPIIQKLAQEARAVLPLAIANSAILGIPLATTGLGLVTRVSYAAGSVIGFTMVLLIVCELRSRMWTADIPRPLQGLPIILLTLAGIGMALHGLRT